MTTKKNAARTALLSALFTALLVPSAFAGEGMPIDLQTAIAKAFASHADIKKAEYSLDAARAKYNVVRESFGPKVTFSHTSGRGGYWQEQPITKDGMIIGYSKQIGEQHKNGFSLKVPIYDASLIASEKKAKAGYQSSVLGEELTFIKLKQSVTDAYFKLLATKDTRQVCEQSVSTLKDHLKNVQAQYDVGVVAKVDLLRSEVELTDAQQNLIMAENGYNIAEANLNNIMGIPQNTKLDPVEELGYTAYEDPLPSSNRWSGNSWPGDEGNNWGAGVNVNMNVFDSGVTKSNVAAAKANLMTAKESYRQDADAVQLDVRNCYFNLREAEKRISTTQVAVAKAEEDYHIAQVRYEAGVGTNTDVLDAQVALTRARNNFNTALYDYNTSRSALQTAMGIEARPDDYKYLTYGERYKATKALYNTAAEATDSEKRLKETVKALEKARAERRKAAAASEKAEKNK